MATYDGTYAILEGRSAKERPKRSARLKRKALNCLLALVEPPKRLAGHVGTFACDDLDRTARDLKRLAAASSALAERAGKLVRDDFSETAADLRKLAAATNALAARVQESARHDFNRTVDDLKALARLSTALARRLQKLARDDFSRTADDLTTVAALSRAFAGRVGNLAREDCRRTAVDARELAGVAKALADALGAAARDLAIRFGNRLIALARHLERMAARLQARAACELRRLAASLRQLAALPGELLELLGQAADRARMHITRQLSTLARHLATTAAQLTASAACRLLTIAACLRSLIGRSGRLVYRSGQAVSRMQARFGYEFREVGGQLGTWSGELKRQADDRLREVADRGRTLAGLPDRLAMYFVGRTRYRYGELAAHLEQRAVKRRQLAEQRARLKRAEREARREIAEERAGREFAERQARQALAEQQARSRRAEQAQREAERQAQRWLAEQARQEAQQVKLQLAEQARQEAVQAKLLLAEQAEQEAERVKLRLAEEEKMKLVERQKVAIVQEKERQPERGRRVLILVENLPSPFDRRVWQEATALRDAGYLVSIICPTGKGYEKKFEDIGGIHIWRYNLPFEANGALGYLAEYATALAHMWMLSWRVYFGRGFDAIHACNPPDLLFLIGGFFKLLGRKFLFDHHDINPELYEAKFGRRDLFYRLLVKLERWSFGAADVSIATNESYRKIAIERGGMRPDRVFVVRSGPSLERMKIVPPVERLKRGRRYLVGYVGVMGKQEGIDCLLRAVRLIVCRHGRTDIHFGLVGGGTSLEEMKALAQRLDIADYVTFTGRVPDAEMLEMLNTADVCVNPDVPNEMNDKSTMNKIMEYMALGKPIVQFDLTEGRYSARAAALNARRDDIADFAARILQLIDDPELRSRMGVFGRERVLNELSWDHEVPRLLAAYECLWASERKAALSSAGTNDAIGTLAVPPAPPAAAS